MRKPEFHCTEGMLLMLEQMKRCDLVQSGKYSETEVWEHPEEWKLTKRGKNNGRME